MCRSIQPFCSILPPHILRKMTASETHRDHALRTLLLTENARGRRDILGMMFAAASPGELRRTIFDAKHKEHLPGKRVRSEGQGPVNDHAADEAYDYSGKTYEFFKTVLQRNSIDDNGMRLDSSVHYSRQYDNAFWDGRQMIYGDGDGEIFNRFTIAIDVVGHELTHGITQYTAALDYQGQSGALNESISDVFGSLVKQNALGQTAAQADWLIGAGLFTTLVKGDALRSMAKPGTAYDDPNIGKDPQPAHMRDYVNTGEDNGGVHINSGIPNHAFFLAAQAIGGYAWEKTGKIWYEALTKRLTPSSDFQAAADATTGCAADLYGTNSMEHKAVIEAWTKVGLIPYGTRAAFTAR